MFPSRRITMGGDVFRDEHSLAFDGTNDYVAIGTNFESTVFNSAFSVSLWVKLDDGRPLATEYLFGTKDGHDNIWGRVETDGDIQFYYKEGTTENALVASAYFADGATGWTHLAFTLSDSAQAMYANGVSIATSSTTLDTSGFAQDTNRNFVIGSRNNTGTIEDGIDGNISEVAIYNKALSASEAKTIYNGREPYNHKEGIASANLQAWWRMGDGVLDGYKESGNGLLTDSSEFTLVSNELLTNGGFDEDSGWEKGDGWSIGGGVATRASGESSDSNLRYEENIVAGDSTYEYSFDYNVTSSTFTAQIGATTIKTNFNGSGTATGYITAGNGTEFTIIGHGSSTGTINNVSIKQITGGNIGTLRNMTASDFEGDTP